MRKIYFTIACLILFAQAALSATYYVDVNGSDTAGDGSLAKPWRTLRYAVTRVAASQGHIIRLSAGTFVEGGLVEVPLGVSIEGAGKDVTILKADPSFYHYPADPGYATDKYLISLNEYNPRNGNQSLKNFTIDGDGKKLHGGIWVKNRSFVVIDGVKVTGTNFNAIWLWDVKDSRITNTDLINCSWGSSSYQVGALNLGNLERVEIDHCYIDENVGYGIKAIGPSGYNDILYTTIHDCTITVNPQGLWDNGSAPNIAIELWMVDPLACEIYNCYIDNTISLVNANNNPSTGNQTIRVHHNTIDLGSRAAGAGYAIELTMHDAEIDHNYIYRGNYGIANWGNPMQNWKIHHNTFYALEGTWPGEIVRSQWGGLHNVDFFNNTVEFAGTRTMNVLGVYGGTSQNVNVKNNLIINSNTAYSYYPNQLIHTENSATITGLTVTNNLLSNIPLGSLTGTYSNNLSVDPVVVKSGNRPAPYYEPAAGSPLIDAGANVGFPYQGNGPDIGAYEYTGAAPANSAPVVSITSPASNSSFTAGSSVTISATASDTDGTVSKVEFFNGTTKLGEDLTSPYSFAWANVAAGSYSLTARATDDDGATKTSTAVAITVGVANTAPSVSITSPSNNSSFTAGSSVTISATASDTDGTVSKVEFFNGTTKLGEDLTSPYSFTWANVSAGSYSLFAKATDDDGATKTSNAAAITVYPPNTAPAVSITGPSNNATFTEGSSVTISVSASDSDGTVSKVEFFNGATKLGEDLTNDYSFIWTNVAAGAYTLTAKATDDDGATKTSTAITITVNPANMPPVISITSPANNSSFTAGSSVTINANASDSDGSVSKVEFFNGETKLGEDITTPYSFTWTSVAAGSYTVSARATDDNGSVATSTSVGFLVEATTQPITIDLYAPDATLAGGMKLTSDASASQGAYFSMPPGSGSNYYIPPSSYAEFTFNVQKTDTYVAWARVKSPGTNQQGFLIYDGKGHWTTWKAGVHTEWTWVKVTNALTNAVATFPFTAGTNSLQFAWMHENVQIDQVIVTNDLAFVPTNSPQEPLPGEPNLGIRLGLYAPDATLFGAMKLTSDATALKGSYFSMPTGFGSNYYIPPPSGAQFNFTVEESGDYTVWARIKSPATNQQGFHIYNGKGSWTTWYAGVHAEWTWVRITKPSSTAALLFPFASGVNSITFGWLHENARVDAIMITNDLNYIPTEGPNDNLAKAETTVSTETQELTAGISAYPNPVVDRFFLSITSNSAQQAMISIVSIDTYAERKMVIALNPGENQIEVDMSGEKRGIYSVSVVTSEKMKYSTKIVVGN